MKAPFIKDDPNICFESPCTNKIFKCDQHEGGRGGGGEGVLFKHYGTPLINCRQATILAAGSESIVVNLLNIWFWYFQQAHFIPIVGVGKRGAD